MEWDISAPIARISVLSSAGFSPSLLTRIYMALVPCRSMETSTREGRQA